MIIPIIPSRLFEINYDASVVFDNGCVYIDNIFKNYPLILDIINNTVVERWKANPDTRNFIDYFDCTSTFSNSTPDPNVDIYFKRIIKEYFNIDVNVSINEYTFNYFKNNILDLASNMQHHPHIDDNFINIIFYLDSISSGGTAIYEHPDDKWTNNEASNLLYDISNIKIKKIIEAKPNRCVLFDGNQLHGGYIADHNKYYYDWRINAVHFSDYHENN